MKTIFFDVDTQLDFLYPAGALAVPGAEHIVGSLNQLTSFAAQHEIQIISTADAHSEDDPEFQTWKPHCVAGTNGQQKTAGTLLSRPFILTSTPARMEFTFNQAKQIIIEKQMLDCFTNPNLRPLLYHLAADRYVVYGVVSELCVRSAAFGLLETGARVELVADAIKSLDAARERELLQQFRSQCGHLTTVSAVTA
ncbi:MAG TPA: isochorismatase family cysteine hydrolase [Bryobacteraceae bacterium]|nr:isochorismatase family cysteine hydrolase [Bryobacteraceae bacterium]